MKVGVPRETAANERRVALVPDTVARLVRSGFEVLVEAGAGESAPFSASAYQAAGATIVSEAAELFGAADIVLKVQKPPPTEVARCRPGTALVGLLHPAMNPDLVQLLAARELTSFSLDLLPRVARAQPMDALSSQATVAGYVSVLLAAQASGRFFPMLVTAAGTLPPAQVLVLGAGVAGLQAIATARRLGAVVQAFDIRPPVKEQVESLGATFLGLGIEDETETAGGYAKPLSEESRRREQSFIAQHAQDADVVISAALIPGKRAPTLVTAEAVEAMKPGSVIVDLAAEWGGNCALTKAGAEVRHRGVRILGPVNLPSTLPLHASQMYSRNISSFLLHVVRDGKLRFDLSDEITANTWVTHQGRMKDL